MRERGGEREREREMQVEREGEYADMMSQECGDVMRAYA
jgi:hypothetical protein